MGNKAVTGRLAPSPTGALHLGHAFSFLAAWWSARNQGGRVILRLEDVDADRAGKEHIDAALFDLKWLGLDWDGEPVIQSHRQEGLRRVALQMAESDQAYPCVCTRGDLSRARSREEESGAPQTGGELPYPGTCRERFQTLDEAEKVAGREAGLRLKTPLGPVSFNDAVFGTVTRDVSEQVGDFLILRRNKTPAYQLAVVVDDKEDGVTEVVRGRDLLDSTCRQILIARSLGYQTPRYLHVPLICDAKGKRLAKRDGDRGLSDLRSAGVRPESIVAWAARHLGQSSTTTDLAGVTRNFDARAIPRADVRLPADLSEIL